MTAETRGRPPSPVVRLARTSTVHLIATELRAAIYSGALAVGSPLGEAELASQLGVSRGPLREAAQRLVQEGLLTSTPGRGLRVATISVHEVADVYEARLAIEGQAVVRITRDGRMSAIGAVERALDELERMSRSDSARDIGDADLEFHQTLVDAAGSLRLSRAMSTLAVETRIATFSLPDGYSVRRSVSPTYRELLAALHARDARAARAALERQFQDAVARLRGEDPAIETVEPAEDYSPEELGPIDLGDAPREF